MAIGLTKLSAGSGYEYLTRQVPASRFGQRLIRVRTQDLDHMFRPIPTAQPIWRRRA